MRVASIVFALFALSTLAACTEHGEGGQFPDPDADIEEGITPAPRGGGFCCPIIDEFTCNCYRNGGWIQRATDMCPQICDQAPEDLSIITDDHGCQSQVGPHSCLAPPPFPDAGVN